MKKITLILCALLMVLGACDRPDNVCANHVELEGDYPRERVDDALNWACGRILEQTALTQDDFDGLEATLRVYGPGEPSKYCDNTSGTCTTFVDGGYHMDVRQQWTGRPSLTDDRISHEMMHVLAFEMGIPGREHHYWMMKKNLCAEMCQFQNPLE